MRPHGSPQVLEQRRTAAIRFFNQDLSLHEIARRMNCNASSVMRWRNAWRAEGQQGLNARPASGRPRRLTESQRTQLVRWLIQGAMAHGYRTELWTTLRVADLIEQRLGIRYHRNHVGKLLHQLGWSHQKPERRALERNEVAIEDWKRTTWPRVKKTPGGWAPTLSSQTNRGFC